jgi:hypothetical protein
MTGLDLLTVHAAINNPHRTCNFCTFGLNICGTIGLLDEAYLKNYLRHFGLARIVRAIVVLAHMGRTSSARLF